MSWRKRLWRVVSELDTAWSILQALIASVAAVGTGYLAVLEQLPWTMAVVAGVLVFTGVLWGINGVNWLRTQKGKEKESVQAERAETSQDGQQKWLAPDTRTLRGKTISNKTIRICDLVEEGDAAVSEVIFDTCTLIGPAVISLSGGQLMGAKLIGVNNIEEALIEVPTGARVSGVVGFQNCIFRNTRFKYIGIIGDPKNLKAFKAAFSK